MKNISRQELGVHILRLGLAGVFLWFGFSQLINSLEWVAIVPDWAVQLLHIPPAMIVMANGLFEVVFAGALAMGFFVRPASFILALHLIVIVFDLGLTATGVRDLGLVLSSLALSCIYTKEVGEKESIVGAN
jgi:uncharacterized membrane protein YphA (DoxX/SURF4 family)